MWYESLSSRGGIDLDIYISKSMSYERGYGMSLVWDGLSSSLGPCIIRSLNVM